MSAELQVGTRVGGYEIVELVGSGGMGRVYRAVQTRLQRVVAMKVILPEVAADGGFRERFQREAQLAASVDHPNVVPVYEADEVDGLLFVTMRWVAGPDLRRVLREGPLEPGRAVATIGQVAEGLDAAHRIGLVHRDIKSANVLTEGPRVYLTDFGVARSLAGTDDRTATGGFVGTLDYAAPELLDGATGDTRSDIYSLGCLLFEALTASVPFPVEGVLAKLNAHGTKPPPAASAVQPQVPAQLDAVVQRAMAKDPAERYATAIELAKAAERALAGDDADAAAAAAPTIPATYRKPPRGKRTDAEPSGPETEAVELPRRRVPRRALAAGIAGPLIAAAVIVFALVTSGSGSKHSSTTPKAAKTTKLAFPISNYPLRSVSHLPKLASLKTCQNAFTAPDEICRSGAQIHVIGHVGSLLHLQRMQFKVTGVSLADNIKNISGQEVLPPPGTRFVIINVEVHNISGHTYTFEPDQASVAGRQVGLFIWNKTGTDFVKTEGPHFQDYSVQNAYGENGTGTREMSGFKFKYRLPAYGTLVFAYPKADLQGHPKALLDVHDLGTGFGGKAKAVIGVVLTL